MHAIFFFPVIIAVSAAAAAITPSAMTTSGPILGFDTAYGGTAFVGVPFASALRWGPPRPPVPWTSPLSTTTPLPGCFSFTGVGSEDCLFANVWLPATPAAGRPMIVWVHGGGFVSGSGTGDFSLLAAGTGAVIVSLNYRLGALGFLAGLDGFAPSLPTPETPTAACANVGLLDQQAGLLWASANAEAFGADPKSVLLMGESAGASSVLFHLAGLEASYPAYRAVAAFSPAAFTNTLAGARATAEAIAIELHCPTTNAGAAVQLACMREAPALNVTTAALIAANTSFLPLSLGPVIDGALVKAVPALALRAGVFNKLAHVIVSTDAFEGDKLLFGFAQVVELTPAGAAAALTQFGLSDGGLDTATLTKLGTAYEPLSVRDGLFNGTSRLYGDGFITCGASWAARGASTHGAASVHRMLWNATFGNITRNVSFPEQPTGRATHGSELSILFSGAAGTAAKDAWAWLANIAVTGDVNTGPKGPASVHWPAYTPFHDILVVNERAQYSKIDTWQEEMCDSLWLPLFPSSTLRQEG
jgi:para-nitrobenzyl esterase